MTIKEIAKQLGISTSTVSRSLNDSSEISQKTKLMVQELAKRINFHRNPHASSLRKGSTKTIAVIIPTISNYFFTLALNAIEEIANENKYHVLIYQTNESYTKEVEIINHLNNGRVDGVIISVARNANKDFSHIENLEKIIPVVFFDRDIDKAGVPSITCDDFESGLVATRHLLENGCKNILFLGLSSQLSVTSKRMQGYFDALTGYQLTGRKENVILCENDTIAAHEIRNALVKIKPDGIFSSVERYTLIVYTLCNELNIIIPNQIKIISFFNSPTAALLAPPLSCITHPAYEMGKAAVASLFQKLRKKRGHAEKDIILKCTFQYRKSSQV